MKIIIVRCFYIVNWSILKIQDLRLIISGERRIMYLSFLIFLQNIRQSLGGVF